MRMNFLAGATAPFAHLLGLAPKRAEGKPDDKPEDRAEDPKPGDHDADPPRETDESDEDYAKRCREARAAAEEKDEPKADAEDGDPDDTEDEDEEGDTEATRQAKARARRAFARGVAGGRKAERARCRAIFANKTAGVRPDVAATLAFSTRMSVKEATEVLASTATVAPAGNLRDAMAAAHTPRIGGGGDGPAPDAGSAKALAAQIIAAGKKRRGEA